VEDGVVISVTVDVHELPRYTHAPNQTKPNQTKPNQTKPNHTSHCHA
jgi:hypothetical protein